MISIVIPTKNEEKVIGKTLRNLRTTTTIAYEVIVSDGNSTDKTVEIAEKYADRVVSDGPGGKKTIAFGRNNGAKVARGEFLLFMDADIYILDPDTFFPRVLEVFEKEPDVLALTVSLRVFPEQETKADWIIFGIVNDLHALNNNVLRVGSASGEFQMIRKSAFEKLGGYDATLAVAEDNDMFLRLSKIGRTKMVKNLCVFQTGRRAHIIGWPRLLAQWLLNQTYVFFFKRSAQDEWKPIR